MKLSFPSYEAGPVTLLVVLIFIYVGGAKLMSMPFMHGSGVRTNRSAIGVLIPKFRFRAALLIGSIMAGATVANLTILHLPGMAGITVALMALVLVLAWSWRPQSIRR
jgi:hypothetical protein